MAFEGPLEDRIAIRELVDSYGDAVFRKDPARWIATWCEEGEWSLPGFQVAGKAQIEAAWLQAMGAFSLAAFFANLGSIRVQGDRAEATVYTQEILVQADGAVRRIIGVYDDELLKRDGGWLFRRRAYRILHDQTQG
jgi:uncharacterized protein (TIGR02246 family)